jgi:hypothetical protein
MAYYINSEGKLASTYGLVGDTTGDDPKASERDSDEGIARTASQQAQIQKIRAETAEQLRRSRWASGQSGEGTYNQGGPVIKGEYKHDNPTYAAYAKSGDGSLLAKGRK